MSESLIPPPLARMLELLPVAAIEELADALAVALAPIPTAAERREAELGPLSRLIESADDGSKDVYTAEVSRETYDRERPGTAPTSRVLVERFGSWIRVRRAAASLLGWKGSIRPWPNPIRGKRRAAFYTREEVLAAIRRCGEETGAEGGVPASSVYYAWVDRERTKARLAGAPSPRIPRQSTVDLHFPGGWGAVREALAGEAP